VSGCRKAEQIEERTEPIPLNETPYIDADMDAKVGLLVGIAPLGQERDRWCFFKMVGPPEALLRERKRFEELIDSLEYLPENATPFSWGTPKGWRRLPGTEFRLATFKTGPFPTEMLLGRFDDPAIRAAISAFQVAYDSRFVEISVSKAGGSILANVNRWRHNDLGLPPITVVDLPRLLRYRSLETATIILIEMAGPGGKKSAMPAFHPPIEQ
jgi:hypothetical protein